MNHLVYKRYWSVISIIICLLFGFICYKDYDKGNPTADIYNLGTDNWMSANDFPDTSIETKLIIDTNPVVYTYVDLEQDMCLLLQSFPDMLYVKDIGLTADSRRLWLFRIGSENASKKILIQAAMHGREYITSQLVVKQLREFLQLYHQNKSYFGYSYNQLMGDTALYIIPMVNPDGISISQLGISGLQIPRMRRRVKDISQLEGRSLEESAYLQEWKANANGVDLNRNFDALWESYTAGPSHLASEGYKGTEAGCEAESQALIDLTLKEKFARTISYHACGECVYWYFGQEEPLETVSFDFAQRIGNTTGYYLYANYEKLDPAGYKDWCIYQLNIPSLTVEVGRDTVPVPAEQFENIWVENRYVLQETLLDIQENND